MTEDRNIGCCAVKDCLATYKSHKWGQIKAGDEGWFFTKENEAFCPAHVPSWVEEWRAKKKQLRVDQKSVRLVGVCANCKQSISKAVRDEADSVPWLHDSNESMTCDG